MNIALITLFPEMFTALSESGITSRAINNKLLSLQFFNPRDYTDDKYQTVDDRPYGGGPGMVMKYEPIYKAIAAAKQSLGDETQVIYLSPQGEQLNHASCQSIQAKHNNLILLCGRYEGVDERIIEALVDAEYSIGDYVLSGGELPAMVLIDAITRFIPGALGHADSATQDSFSNGLLDYPHYTRPEEINGLKIPPVLASGNHQDIARWRTKQSLLKTWQKRPDLLKRRTFMPEEKLLLQELGITELTEDKENE